MNIFSPIGSLFFIVVVVILTTQNVLAQKNNYSMVGHWQSEDGKLKQLIIFKDSDNYYYGKDENNKMVLSKLLCDDNKNTYKGNLTPPNENIQLDAKLSFVDNNKLKVVASKLFMSKTMYLIRKND